MAKKTGRILIVDDNAGIRRTLEFILKGFFEELNFLPGPSTLLSAIDTFKPHVVLLDMNFRAEDNNGNEGIFWLKEIIQKHPEISVVLFTAYADIPLAVQGMKNGAIDFIEKPWDNVRLISVLRDAVKTAMKKSGNISSSFFKGKSKDMQEIWDMLVVIANSPEPVNIIGEEGTEKELVACEIRRLCQNTKIPDIQLFLPQDSHRSGRDIRIPPLRERKEDIVPMAMHIIRDLNFKTGKDIEGITHEACELMKRYLWPGNTDELYQRVEKAYATCKGNQLKISELFKEKTFDTHFMLEIKQLDSLEEEKLIRQCLDSSGYNITATAKMLSLSRPTLYAKIHKYNIDITPHSS